MHMIDARRSMLTGNQDDILAQEIIQETTGGKNPEQALVDDFLAEVDGRLEQVKVYFPIIDMIRKRNPGEGLAALVPELSFLLLGYLIYEGKLRYRGITFHHLQTFLGKALQTILLRQTEPDTVRQLTAEILDGLQNGGRNFSITTYHFAAASFREKYIKFLEIKQSDAGELHYYITEQGVDFYLKTKEFPDETKITINLLLFQKQMEKGAFGFAYETVRRLNMEVQKKKDRKYSLLEAMMYGQLDSGEAYNEYHRSIAAQFDEETELFNTAMKNVASAFNEYMERINKGEADAKQIRTLTLIKIIEREISKAQTLHTELLREAVSLTGEYDKALRVRRKAIFTERFHFQNEFEKLASPKGQPDLLKFLFEPLLTPNRKKRFNPLRACETQRIIKSRNEEAQAQPDAERVDRPTIDTITGNRVKKNFLFYAARLLEALDRPNKQVYLEEFCCLLKEMYSENSVYNGDFISFVIEMNRDKKIGEHSRIIHFGYGSIPADEELKTMETVFRKAVFDTHLTGTINQITVKSFPETEIELLPGLKITNMVFTGDKK